MESQSLQKYRDAEKRLWDHYGVAPKEHFLHLPGLNLKVRVLEVGQGEPVFFLHGSPNAGPKWAPLVAKMTDFRCLILDRPGCGLSEPVDYQKTDLRTLASDLLCQTLDSLGLPRVNLVSSSLGGTLAFYFTMAHPERVERLVQEGCPAFLKGFRMPFFNLVSTAVSLLTGLSFPSRTAFRSMGHAPAIDQGRFEAEVLVWRDALMKYTDTGKNENALNRHLSSRMSVYTYGVEDIRKISLPTLYLWGEADSFGGPALGRALVEAQPNATLKTFPASGHLPWLDDVETHAQHIRTFLRNETELSA